MIAGKEKILIIDDEQDFCRLIKMNLEAMSDFVVDISTDGKKGIELAKKTKPALILLDIVMPGMNGFEVLERLKKDKETLNIPVVMLTAKGDKASKIKAQQLHNEEYIMKPIEAKELRVRIEKILKRKAAK